jgi:hypothetical protein
VLLGHPSVLLDIAPTQPELTEVHDVETVRDQPAAGSKGAVGGRAERVDGDRPELNGRKFGLEATRVRGQQVDTGGQRVDPGLAPQRKGVYALERRHEADPDGHRNLVGISRSGRIRSATIAHAE